MSKRKLSMNVRLPLVVILGATGSGKTKLSLELAKRFNGEIIGADSMQVYKALDIVTAKATKTELNTVQHHLINILEPFDTFTVTDYRNKALSVIDSLLSQNKLPIVVGGTNYYIESLLWKILIDNPKEANVLSDNTDLSNEELHSRLKMFDPIMADRLHPNNRRKVLRSLEILQQTGRKQSDILYEQHQPGTGGSSSDGGLRYKNCIILSLLCNQMILDNRLNKRVDEMLETGLLKELTNFHKLYKENAIINNVTPVYTKGIFQSIGFKEFHEYLMLDNEQRTSDKGATLLKQGIEDLKIATRRYARKQNRWITNRFLGRTERDVPPVYGLSTDDIEKWNEKVLYPAIDIIDSFMNEVKCKYERMPVKDVKSKPNSLDRTYKCDVCDRIFIGDFQWNSHITSRRHKKRLANEKVQNNVSNQ